jgi:uncharacterized membrane protein YfcA
MVLRSPAPEALVIDPAISLAGFLVGFVVGLTGMGGGALMTPLLVLVFGIEPLSAVSSDIVASLIMKPIGAGVHWRRGTVNRPLVKWLVLGSVPSAFLGVLALRHAGSGPALQGYVKMALGIALLVVAAGLVIRPLLARAAAQAPVVIRPLPTVLIGIVGGLVVGITSVGSGSLMIILLLTLYPGLRLSSLVGTDLAQAIPLVGSAALGHLLFGQFQPGLTLSILVGSIPGVYLAARLSARAPDHVIRPALVTVLTASALKLLGSATPLLIAATAMVAAAALAQSLRRRPRPEVTAVSPAASEPSPLPPVMPEPLPDVAFPEASP